MFNKRAWCAVAAGLVMAGGCASNGPVDLAAAGRVHVSNGESNTVFVSAPQVQADNGVLVVTGTLTRRPDYNGPVPGRLVVTVFDVDGKTELDEFTTGWDPPHVPVTGDRRATYTARYGWLPPDGATVRVDHEANPDGPEETVAGNARYYSPGYRRSDVRKQLTNGLGGDKSWWYNQPRRINDSRAR